MEDYVTLERSDDTMIVRFDRQGALNAFDQKMITELTDTAKLLAEDLTVRSVVLTGASAAFSSGIDLKDAQNWDLEAMSDLEMSGLGGSASNYHCRSRGHDGRSGLCTGSCL